MRCNEDDDVTVLISLSERKQKAKVLLAHLFRRELTVQPHAVY